MTKPFGSDSVSIQTPTLVYKDMQQRLCIKFGYTNSKGEHNYSDLAPTEPEIEVHRLRAGGKAFSLVHTSNTERLYTKKGFQSGGKTRYCI